MKKVLLVIATHGDEKIGPEVITKLKRPKLHTLFDVLVANPRALAANKRFLEADLNRSYPGDSRSIIYEKRLAACNLEIARKYDYVIDIHEASAGKDDFIIIPRQKISGKFPLQFINLKTVLLWPDPPGPMGQFLPQVIELEFGMKNKNRRQVIQRTANIVAYFLENVAEEKPPATIYQRKNFYYVYGKVSLGEISATKQKFKDFRETVWRKEKFYPLLVNQYRDLGILCYKMKRK